MQRTYLALATTAALAGLGAAPSRAPLAQKPQPTPIEATPVEPVAAPPSSPPPLPQATEPPRRTGMAQVVALEVIPYSR